MFKNPELDSALITTIHHESFLMKSSWDEFERLANKQILSTLNATECVSLFSFYTSFLHHLYEFYLACFKRQIGNDSGFGGREGAARKDRLFTAETQRVFDRISARLEAGKGQGWENDPSYYKVAVPIDFAEDLRNIRNSSAHALTSRAAGDIDLSDFYHSYHKYVYELFRSAREYWGAFSIENLDMKAISRFSVLVRT
ncbi:hypothetical protein [Pseudomonas sp. S31]|uniref:hypothetical protein n=1 Tax=Pseudomonas sp. S31 TaxID=1564473 RepID=UPI0019136272|nr:hypothetical protein [Pseudomonas sp. S31]